MEASSTLREVIMKPSYNNRYRRSVVQSIEYYSFGLQFADGTGLEKQAYKYNGKEFDQMHNLNWSDYTVRQYDLVVPRFPTTDRIHY